MNLCIFVEDPQVRIYSFSLDQSMKQFGAETNRLFDNKDTIVMMWAGNYFIPLLF